MKKQEIQELLRANKIFNNYDLLKSFSSAGVDDIAIRYVTHSGMRVSGTEVYSPSHKTDPQAHWMNYGKMFFMGAKSETMKKATEWASEHYKVKEWKNSPFGEKIPDTVYARLQKFIKEQK